jgi:hypothetical protein
MRATIRRQLSMAEKVLDFSKEHAATDPGYAGVVSRLEQTLTRANTLAQEAVDTSEGELLAVRRRADVRRKLQAQFRHLAGVAVVAGKAHPGLAELFRAPGMSIPNRNFLGKAKILLERATEHIEPLKAAALGEQFLAELTAGIAEFEEMGESANLDRVIHVGARRDLRNATSECLELIGALDGFNRARFATDGKLLAAWEAARNVFGPVRRRAPLPEGVVGEIPPAPSAKESAA